MKTILLKDDLSNCCGCGACATVCPKQAITMQINANGSVYPQIDQAVCIQCGQCVRVCSFHTKPMLQAPKTAYAAVGREVELVSHSASGGVFASLAQAVMRDGVVAAGAVLTLGQDGADVFHIVSEDLEGIRRMQGSKYVHSDAWRCYGAVCKALKEGKTVLFSGTPCQAAAVKQLTGDPENLITMDLICHGVPPKQMLRDYLKLLEKRFVGTVEDLCFRDKSVGRDFTARVGIKRGQKRQTYYIKSSLMSFYSLFLKGSIYRESCYHCPYAGIQRISDITIGDYWGIREHHGEDLRNGAMPNHDHWSCILVNSEKGQKFLERYGQALILRLTQTDWIRQHNQQLNAPSKKPADAEDWISTYAREGYPSLEKTFIQESGGVIRYYWKLWKSVRQFRKAKESRK